MDKQTLHQVALDAGRLTNAADRICSLRDAYMNTLEDLRIAQGGLKVISIWAKSPGIGAKKEFDDIHNRAIDTLALISEANR